MKAGGEVASSARYELGIALYQAGDTEASVKILQAAVRERPEVRLLSSIAPCRDHPQQHLTTTPTPHRNLSFDSHWAQH